jgi:hypothetical protein
VSGDFHWSQSLVTESYNRFDGGCAMAPDRVGRLQRGYGLDRCAQRTTCRTLAGKPGRQDLQACASGLQSIKDPQKLSTTPGQSVEPLDDQQIARTDEFENRVQNGAVRTGRFMSYHLATCSLQQGGILV